MRRLWTFSDINVAYRCMTEVANNWPEQGSRNGRVKSSPLPLIVSFKNPRKRVLFDANRDANPFFHLFESIWMLAGRNDVKFLSQFNSNISSFSDDGETFNAGYGHRWRSHFGKDQLMTCSDLLRNNPDDRRVVLGIWDPSTDLGSDSKDIPCNTQAYFRVIDGRLNMTTTNRSNDLIWGLLGANYVHMTIMHEFMAASAGYELGTWHHMTNNLHVYERHWDLLCNQLDHRDYPGRQRPMVCDPERFLVDCERFATGEPPIHEPFFETTVAPMLHAWKTYKKGEKALANRLCENIHSDDWRIACTNWIRRRMK